MKKLVVAIDGPAGAGKSTVAQIAAKKLPILTPVLCIVLLHGKPFSRKRKSLTN